MALPGMRNCENIFEFVWREKVWIDVICIIAIPYSLPSRMMRLRIVDTWILFMSQRIIRITDSATRLEYERTTVVCKGVISFRQQKQEIE
jgi:hypothetical protein